MLLVSVPKGPTSLTNILHSASQMVTLISVDNISFVSDVVLVLGGYHYILNCVVALEAGLDSCCATYIAFTNPLE